ncbi:hypothetical protein [uncultured Hyphomonas sp.]|uniref:hypothetical protein n=1 Tax=uncultured Hyphomonas sp. TaxID=225298 RepID=UPI002AAB9D8F|nr:hypothetical protein [uncultured Hyphomonas sp.]
MQELMTAWQADVAKQPQWVQHWLDVMVIVLGVFGAAFSFVRVEARWVLAGFLAGAATMLGLYSQIGYSRLLGLAHVIFWTPVLVYLLRRHAHWRVGATLSGKWIVLAVMILTISLAFDYTDVIRWILGER